MYKLVTTKMYLSFRRMLKRMTRSRRCGALFGVIVITTLAFSFLENYFVVEYRTSQQIAQTSYSADNYRTLLPGKYKRSNPKILLWTKFFGEMIWYEESKNVFTNLCHSDCTVTDQKSEIETADAIVFHLNDISWGGDVRNIFGFPFPTYRRPDQVWVLYTIEPISMLWGDFTAWEGVFNWTWCYTRGSDIYAPYGWMRPLTEEEKYNQSHNTHSNMNYDYFSRKDKTAGVAVISDCLDDAHRYKLIDKLRPYLDIDVYGGCGKACPRDYSSCNELLPPYKFYLAFENSDCRDYVTEKYWRAIIRGQIPIVAWKIYSMTDLVLPNSYINVYDFKDLDAAGAYIKKVSENKTLYNSYFKWKATHTMDAKHGFCVLCEHLKDNSVPSQVYHDVNGFLTSFSCPPATVSSYSIGFLLDHDIIFYL